MCQYYHFTTPASFKHIARSSSWSVCGNFGSRLDLVSYNHNNNYVGTNNQGFVAKLLHTSVGYMDYILSASIIPWVCAIISQSNNCRLCRYLPHSVH